MLIPIATTVLALTLVFAVLTPFSGIKAVN
jgi:hypothetical protein